jgi:hypothetical protein
MDRSQTQAGAADDVEYAAWTPTITGHLSFSLIGQAGSDAGCVTANGHREIGASHMERQVAVVQRRVTEDLPFRIWPIPLLMPGIAADYILIGVSQPARLPKLSPDAAHIDAIGFHDSAGALAGEIIVAPFHPFRWWREYAAQMLRAIRLEVARCGDDSPRGATEDIEPLLRDIRRRLDAGAAAGLTLLRLRFKLYRTGEFRLILSRGDFVGVESEQGLDDPTDRFLDAFASQAYYFVKDVVHRHYHHDPKADNLLPVKRTTGDTDEVWRRETLWSLTRAVLEKRRVNNLPGYQSALGILAYADAFQSLLARIKRSPNDPDIHILSGLPPYDFRHTRLSLESKMAEVAWSRSLMSNAAGLVLSSLIAAAALWIGAVQVTRQVCGDQPNACPVPAVAADAFAWIIQNPAPIAAALIVVAAAYLQFAKQSLRTVPLFRLYTDLTVEWSLALGASLSRCVRRLTPLLGDWFGTFGAAFVALALGGVWIWGAGKLFRLW